VRSCGCSARTASCTATSSRRTSSSSARPEALEAKGGANGGYNSLPDTCSDKQDEDEQPAWTAAKSLDPGIAANAGFTRSDSLLLVIAITNEDEALSMSWPTIVDLRARRAPAAPTPAPR
jgi:hypothetical protein